MKKLILSALLVLGMAASSWATPYNLNASNYSGTPADLAGWSGTIATADISGTTVTFTGNSFTYNGNSFEFLLMNMGLNVSNAPLTATVTSPTTPGFSQYISGNPAPNFGSFGDFNVVVQSDGNGSKGAYTPVVFTLSDIPSLINNSAGKSVAAHYVIWENGENTGVTLNASTGGSTPVPEPGTMMLLGIGMLGMAVYGKRRMNKA